MSARPAGSSGENQTEAYRQAYPKGCPKRETAQVEACRMAKRPDIAALIHEFIPRHYRRIAGIDFGWDHPTGAAELAYDADADKVIVVRDAL